MNRPISKLLRCAIYTRKSTEHNLHVAFTSLDAQREACAAYIQSQAQEGWRRVPKHYEDAGLSGASLQRPALQAMLAEVRARRVEIVLVRASLVRIVQTERHLFTLKRLHSRSMALLALTIIATPAFSESRPAVSECAPTAWSEKGEVNSRLPSGPRWEYDFHAARGGVEGMIMGVSFAAKLRRGSTRTYSAALSPYAR